MQSALRSLLTSVLNCRVQILVEVKASEVRDRINVSATEGPDVLVEQFIAEGAVTVATETGLTIDPDVCTAPEAVAIRNLAAIYLACHVTGGKAQGLTYQLGDLQMSEPSFIRSGASGNLEFLLNEAKAIIAKLNEADFRAVTA